MSLFSERKPAQLQGRICMFPRTTYALFPSALDEAKNAWATCFNVEAQTCLRRYLETRQTDDNRLFPISEVTLRRAYREANSKTGLRIKPQILRDWFCCQLGELGVPDRYVDAFCGRIPKSVLARHYTNYSPDKLKRIYNKANLRIMS